MTFKAVNITLAGGTSYDKGGSIYAYWSYIRLSSVNFANNTQTGSSGGEMYQGGGAIFSQYGDIYLYESVHFTGCSAAYGGAIKLLDSSLTSMGGNVFSHCSTYMDGGAIHSYGGSVQLMGSNDVFDSCVAGSSGGAIGFAGTIYNIMLYNATFVNNKANDYGSGGAICWTSPCSFIMIDGCTFDSNEAGTGGSLYLLEPYYSYMYTYLSLSNCEFTNNKAKHYQGGAIYSKVLLMITNSVFNGNEALEHDGGALFMGTYSGTSVIRQSTFQNCSSVGTGGCISALDSGLSVISTEFQGCTATEGGALAAGSLQLNTYHVTMTNNVATHNGGAVLMRSSTYNSTSDIFTSNQVLQGYGGAIYADTAGGSYAWINWASFFSNFAPSGASDIYSDSTYGIGSCTVLTPNISTDVYTQCVSPYGSSVTPTMAPTGILSPAPTPSPTNMYVKANSHDDNDAPPFLF